MGSQRLGRDWITEHTHTRPQILISESAFGQIMILSSRSAIPRANKQMQPPTPHRPHHSHYPAQALSLGPLCPHKWPSCLWTSEPVIQEPDQPLNFTKKATEHKQEQWLAQLDRISIWAAAAAAAKSLQLCLTLCDPKGSDPPGSPVPGILQARTLQWVAISFSNAWKWKVKVKLLSGVWLLATPWTAAYQARPSMGFSRQEYWNGVPLPSPSIWARTQNLWFWVLGSQMPHFP